MTELYEKNATQGPLFYRNTAIGIRSDFLFNLPTIIFDKNAITKMSGISTKTVTTILKCDSL